MMDTNVELLKSIKKYIVENYVSKYEGSTIRFSKSKKSEIRFSREISSNDEEASSKQMEIEDDPEKKIDKRACEICSFDEKKTPKFEIVRGKSFDESLKVYNKKLKQYNRTHCRMTRDIKKLSKQLGTTWSNEVFLIIDKKKYKDSDVYKRAGISKQTFSKFRKTIKYQPMRDTAIQMCFGLMLNLDQSIDLLAKAGFGLSNASARDLVVKYFLDNEIYDILELNYVLDELSLDLFNIN